MNVAIVHDFLTKIGGAEKVLLSLTEMFPEAPIYTLLYDENGTKNYFKDKKIIASNLNKYPSFLRKPKILLPKLPLAIEQFDFSKYDIVISSSNSFAHGILTKPHTLHICYCHSPMRYVWDWYHEYLAEHNLGFGLKGLIARQLLHRIRLWDRASSERVDFWISNSLNVQKRIKKYYQKDSAIIYPPVTIDKIPLQHQKGDYYLILSRLEPYKNIDLAIKAFNENGKSLQIIGTGSREKYLRSIAKENIIFLGWQSDEKVYDYLGHAKSLIFPGEEDFGITPVEAMAAGTPVIALKQGGLLESLQDGITGIFFEEPNETSLNEAIARFENIEFNADACRNQAEHFSADIFKKNFNTVLEEQLFNYHGQTNE